MQPQILKIFYDNEPEREAVKEFLILCLKEMAIQKTFDGEDITGIKDAHDNIIKSFDKLAELYAKIKKPVVSDSR